MGEVTDELRCPVFRGQEEKTICKVLRSESFLFQVERENNYVFLAKIRDMYLEKVALMWMINNL